MTKFISEDQIEATIAALDADDQVFAEAIEEFKEEQPVIFSFFFSESVKLLTQAEREFLFYLGVIIWKSIQSNWPHAIPEISEEQLGAAEENNWTLLESITSKNFNDRLNPFFEDSPQEDLLAFVEDMLVPEEDNNDLSKEGREPIFVTLKSVIDCLTKTH